MAIPYISPFMKKIFGTRNQRLVKRYLRIVDQVSAFEDEIRTFSDPELRAKTDEFRRRLAEGESDQALIPEVFAVAREAMDRAVGIRNIFNPDESFDPAVLPEDMQTLYAQVKAEIEKTEPKPPTGDLLGSEKPVESWMFVDIPPELYEAVRQWHPDSKPPYRARPFDVQIIGAIVLYEGRIAEMKTGEGKTIVAPLACYLAALQDQQVHVVTVNDYLVQRDRDWTFPFFRTLGLTVGAIHPHHEQPPELKKLAYDCDVLYGTTSEFGFDYLRDNMKLSAAEQVQKRRHFAVVDEVDSTLIDEARTPLIISGLAHEHKPRYDMADTLARELVQKQKEWNDADQKVQSCLVEISGLEGDIRNAREKSKIPPLKEKMDAARKRLPEFEDQRDRFTQYYEVEMDKKRANITHEGIAKAQKIAGVGSFYVGDNMDIPHLLEQAIRAHTVYQRDRDYVVAPDEHGEMSVIIVDQNTGRKMIGRQWSDGLHQAVESKEKVPIKDETQTMATITIQNFFKLYDKLAGMTGTADTEATEFYEIYKLDVVVIPTNVPVVRVDHNDLVLIAEKDKWEAIVDEIKIFHDAGRPMLVGTTSVEKSEHLSNMLTRKYNIKHEVLNAKHHEREADIISSAGQLGSVTIATNMAGRGTDIKLGRFRPEDLIDHWKRRGICPKQVNPDMPEDEIIATVYRHIAPKELDRKKNEIDDMSDEEIRSALLQKWYVEHCFGDERKAGAMSDAALTKELDQTQSCILHKLRCFRDVEDLGGLHVIGTERHESRRVDNQLRGRCGRQGDNGSSRFFLSLEDDLMKMFAGKTTLNLLSKLGMKEGDAIEHPMLTKAVGRAQRKVEERNFLIRKNILEYDEVMDHQRHSFYGMRQDVLEGRRVKELIFEQIDDSVEDAVFNYLDKIFVANCISEWIRETLSVSIDPDRIKGKDREDLHTLISIDAKEEAGTMIRVTLGEYIMEEINLDGGAIAEGDAESSDYKGLADWANAAFKANVKEKELRELSREEIIRRLEEAAYKLVDDTDLAPLDQYLVGDYGAGELVKWATNKFEAEFKAEEFAKLEDIEDATEKIKEGARKAYASRETTYPVEFALDLTTAQMQMNPEEALKNFCQWVKFRYELDWKPDELPSANPAELRTILIGEAQKWDESRINERADRALVAGTSPEALDKWFRENMNTQLTDEEKERAADDPKTVAEGKIASELRSELTQFERWVLLQIVDQAWKDHLHAMDQLKESIGFRSFSQKDPRIEFKREGARLFDEMHMAIRDKVTDLIFKGRLAPQVVQRPPQGLQGQPVPRGTQSPDGGRGAARQVMRQHQRPVPRTAEPAIAAAAAAASATGTAAQRRSLDEAQRAGQGVSKLKRRPMHAKVTVGRNEPCPCGSGKKYKRCCGKRG